MMSRRRTKGLTERQKTVLDTVEVFQNKNGYPPSIREIKDRVGISSTSVVNYYLEQLEEMGYTGYGLFEPAYFFFHMIPNAMAPLIVEASLGMAGYVVAEAALSFLGFGIQDPIPTWGNMLSATQTYMFDRPWLPLVPGFPIFLCSLAFNYIGDGLRDALDPRLKL